jgi:hypothetical protein
MCLGIYIYIYIHVCIHKCICACAYLCMLIRWGDYYFVHMSGVRFLASMNATIYIRVCMHAYTSTRLSLLSPGRSEYHH